MPFVAASGHPMLPQHFVAEFLSGLTMSSGLEGVKLS
jgi:hypothetical protein